jgi:hypothetical protein
MLTPLALDLARATIHDRLQQAARDALADQLRRTRPARTAAPFRLAWPSVTPRHWLADGLRGLAARLDPSASVADGSLVVLKAR